MTKPVRLDAAAEREVEEAYVYYEQRVPGLGERFLDHLTQAFEFVQSAPEACVPVDGAFSPLLRSTRVRRFPFRVVFAELPDRYRVFAVSHDRQEPNYWRERVP